MLDFRRRRRSPGYTSRGEQVRWLALVMTSGIVLLVVLEAGKPDNWRLLFGMPAGAATAPGAAGRGAPRVPRRAVDQLAGDEPGVFLALADPPPDPVAETPASPEPNFFPGVRPDHLRLVRDDTVHRGSERDAFFHLLELLARTDETTLEQAWPTAVSYVQLDEQPQAYRGRLVTMRGTIRRARLIDAVNNSYGIRQFFTLVLEPAGGPAEPLILNCVELPVGFPQGERLDAEVSVTGFFYKRWAYQAHDQIRVAPLILARTVDWHRPVVAARPTSENFDQTVFKVLLAMVAGLALCIYFMRRSRRAVVERRRREQTLGGPDLYRKLDGAALTPPSEQALNDLSRHDG